MRNRAKRKHAEQAHTQQVHATRAWEAQAYKTQACTAPRIIWMHGGVDEKGDVGDGDEQSPQDLDERGAPSRCRRR